MSAGDATKRLHEAIDLVAGIDVSELPTAEELGELLEELTRCTRRLEFELRRLLRSFEARGDHVPLGYRTAKQRRRARGSHPRRAHRRHPRCLPRVGGLAGPAGHRPDMRGLRTVLRRWRLEVDPGCDEPGRIERGRDAHVSATFQGAS